MSETPKTAKQIANSLKSIMRCNCNLDSWEPEPITGHSWVCRIHKATLATLRGDQRYLEKVEKAALEAGDE